MSAQFEHPDFPREIADAPDIDNIPVAESMHALMGAVAEMHHTLRQVQQTFALPLIQRPAPEPEYVVGETIADISIRGCHAAPLTTLRGLRRDGGWRTSGGNWDDVNVESVRPLVVIDPERARALVHDHFNDHRSRALLDALLDGAS